jgi:hypothetical protein
MGMCKSRILVMATVLASSAVILPMPAAAESATISDLSKSGYSCREVGEARHVCTRGDTDPAYGCEQDDCKIVPRPAKSTGSPALTKPLPKGAGIGNITIAPADVE